MTLTTLLDSTIDRIGDWNPQLFRELKGRLTVRSLLLTAVFVIIGYVLIQVALSGSEPQYITIDSTYCHLPVPLTTNLDPGNECPPQWIDLMPWWISANQSLFLWIGVAIMFGLIGAGMYLLTQDLAKEKRQGTLNFILFSPQSTRQIVWGKLLGVPIFLYVAIALSIPFHFWIGFQGGLSLWDMVSYYVILAIAACLLFHIAILTVTLSPSVSGFEAWLTSGAAIALLAFLNGVPLENFPFLLGWLKLFCPSLMLPFVINRPSAENYEFINSLPFHHGPLSDWTWFGLPIGSSAPLFIGLMVVNYGIWLYWCDRALQRRFRNPSTTVLTKAQAYQLILTSNLLWFGFLKIYDTQSLIESQIILWLFLASSLTLLVLGATFPQRQPLIDWARYHHEFTHRRSLVRDLLLGEHSPNFAVVLVMIIILIIVPQVMGQTMDYLDGFIGAAATLALWFCTHTILCYLTTLQPIAPTKPFYRNFIGLTLTCPLTISVGAILVASALELVWEPSLLLIVTLILDSLVLMAGSMFLSKQFQFWGQSETHAILFGDAAGLSAPHHQTTPENNSPRRRRR